MAKALSCLECGTVRTFRVDNSVTECDCGLVVGWWHDQSNGLAKLWVTEVGKLDRAQVISLHNGFLRARSDLLPTTFKGPDGQDVDFPQAQQDGLWRQVHTEATRAPRLPDYLQVFDASRRDCWAVIQQPGRVPDSIWAEPAEALARGCRVPVGVV